MKKPIIDVDYLGADVWDTFNQSNGHKHVITYTTVTNDLICDCDGYHFEKHCQHIDAVKAHETYKTWKAGQTEEDRVQGLS